MKISKELIDLVLTGTKEAINRIFDTEGPLAAFMLVETTAAERRIRELPEGTPGEELIEFAGQEGTQRYVYLTSGRWTKQGIEVPALLAHGAERGDSHGFIVAQAFVAGLTPRYRQMDGQMEIVEREANFFCALPLEVTSDSLQSGCLLQESLGRFARRLLAAAFAGDEVEVSLVQWRHVDGQPTASGGCYAFHQPSGTRLQCEFEYRGNVFQLGRIVSLTDDLREEELSPELRTAIEKAYHAW